MVFFVVSAVFFYVVYRVYQHYFPAPSVDPKGKYVLISGCDTGFGHALAIELDKQGYNVLAGVYSADSKDQLVNKLSLRAAVFSLDISRQEDIESAYKLVKEKTNTVHALVNNAGISTGGHIDWVSIESIRQVMEINFFGHVAMTKTFLPLLTTKRDSRVVNICSCAGFLSVPSASAYCASKYALESFSDCLRREMFSWGLRVSVIEPAFMRTPILRKHGQAVHELRTELSTDVQQRWGDEFFQSHFGRKPMIFVRWAEDPIKVVRDLQHAVTSTAPRIRYRSGWQSEFVWFPLSMMPDWLVDFYFAKQYASPVLPVGVKNQLQ